MAADSGSYTPETIARRQALADALYKQGMGQKPMTHWMQGLAQLGDTLSAGMLERKNRQDEKEGREELAKILTQGQTPPIVAPSQPTKIPDGVTPIVPQASTSGKVYANDEPSPLDPPSGADRDMAIRTVLAEAGNQSPEGKLAVANVLRNRAVSGNFGGDTLPGVIQKPYQFEPWNTAGGRAKMAAIDPASPQYQQAGQLLEMAYTGANDPTKGATHFYAPKAQAALGRPAPSWDNGAGVDIQDHRFFGGAGTPQVTAGASGPTEMSAQSRQMPQNIAPQSQPQAAPAQPSQREQVAAMLRSNNPYVRQHGAQLAQGIIQQQFAAPTYDFKVAGDALYRTSSKSGTVERVGGATKPTYGVIGKDQFGNEQYGWIDPGNKSVSPTSGTTQASPGAPPSTTGQAPTAQQGGIDIPPPPPGADPKAWRATFTKEAAEKAAGAPQAKARAQDSISSLFKTGQKALDLATHKGLDAAVGPISSKLPTFREDTANFETDIENLGTRIFINTINQMRELSKTGGAVGSVTEKEMTKLENAMQNLSLRQGQGNMRKNLSSVAGEINDSMKRIADAYKTQYGEELPFEALKIPDMPASGNIDALVKKYGG